MAKVVVQGGDKLLKKLKQLGPVGLKALPPAVVAGMDVMKDAANRAAPGPHIVMGEPKQDDSTGQGAVKIEIGPDKEHWHYRFFETGVQPFVINLLKGRTKRTSSLRKNKQTGEYTRVKGGGRKVKGSGAQALKFGSQYASIVKRGGMAARPFLRPTLALKEPVSKRVGDVMWAAVDSLSEGK